MTYHFTRSAASVEAKLRKVAASQIKRALEEIDDSELGPRETVHQVRKRCKKLRGLVRLVSGAFDDYKSENQRFRDAAAELSYARDAEVIVQTYDKLIACHADQIDPASFPKIRARLSQRKTEILNQNGLKNRLWQFRDKMSDAWYRVEHWTLDEAGFEAVAGGLSKTYKRARSAMRKAAEEPTPEHLHEWRKSVKYH